MTELINIQFLERFLGSSYFLLVLFSTFFLLKTYILYNLINKNALKSNFRLPLFLLKIVIISTLFSDSAWILKTIRDLFYLFDIRIYVLWVRICWSTIPIQYLALSLFIDSISSQSITKLSLRQKIYTVLNLTSTFFILCATVINFNYPFTVTPILNFLSQKLIVIYNLFIVILPSIYFCIKKIRNNELPKILAKQLTLLMGFVIIPFCLSDFLQIYPFNFSETWITNSYTFVSLANILLTYAVYYCSRRIIGLRFLNFDSHVKAPAKFNFMNNFREILERFSQVTKIQELSHITCGFFKEIFGIPLNRVTLHIRNTQANTNHSDTELTTNDRQAEIVETFMSTHADSLCLFIKNNKILIYDEIAFSHFYDESPVTNNILTFLEAINADIFIPVYEKGKMIAYIIIDRHARLHEFYSDLERDEMIVFASYLGNLINLLQTRSLDVMIHEEKELNEELYRKHQEINQYKESIRSFLRSSKQKQIGIIFYKNRKFTFGNQAATDLIGFNLNNQQGHPLARAIKTLAQQVETYGTPQTQFTKDNIGNNLVIAGVPHLEKNSSIVLVYYPEISDIIKQQIDLLKDPSERDYLLYLETTKSGQLINELIPGSGEILLNFKIDLLKTALNKKALLIDLPEEDLLATVELLHHVSARKNLHVLTLNAPVKDFSIATQLFGINPIFGSEVKDQSLLQKLNDTGTLFIKNIHFLDLETQSYLAEFIRYGYYRIFKSEQKEVSNVRIICSSNQNLQLMSQSGTFSPALFNEISRTHVSMPSLLTLPDDELRALAQGYSEQAIKTQTFKNLLMLTDKDKDRIASNRPASLHELKSLVHHVLLHKSKQTNIDQEAEFDHILHIDDNDITKAARLGKHALKDLRIMTMLWKKFNNQNKIATFLGVNRSSVNRRCKEYNLL